MTYYSTANQPPGGPQDAKAGRVFRIVGIVLLVVGLLLAGGAVFAFVQSNQSSAERSAEADGTVVDIVEQETQRRTDSGARRTSITYCPVVAYSAGDAEHRVEAAVCSDDPPRMGEQVTVMYNPADPADAAIDSWAERWFLVTILGGISLVFVLIGGLLLRFSGRARTATRNRQSLGY